jgi:hypothetical protein
VERCRLLDPERQDQGTARPDTQIERCLPLRNQLQRKYEILVFDLPLPERQPVTGLRLRYFPFSSGVYSRMSSRVGNSMTSSQRSRPVPALTVNLNHHTESVYPRLESSAGSGQSGETRSAPRQQQS